MADISDSEATEAVRLIGSQTNGTETTFAGVSDNQDLKTTDVIDTSGVFTSLSVTNAAAVEVKVGATALAERKVVTIMPEDGGPVYWGYANTVTSITGTPIYKRQLLVLSVTDNVPIWLIAGSGTIDVRITEGA